MADMAICLKRSKKCEVPLDVWESEEKRIFRHQHSPKGKSPSYIYSNRSASNAILLQNLQVLVLRGIAQSNFFWQT